MGQLMVNGQAARFIGFPSSVSPTPSGDDPIFTETVIADNSGESASFTFDEDYHDYDFVEITFKNTSTSAKFSLWTTPNAIDACLGGVAERITVNFTSTNIYATYTESVSGNTITWTRSGSRTCIITEISGVSCTNKTVSETEIYEASALSSTALSITTQESLFDYDLLVMVCNASDRTEVVPSNTLYPTNYPSGFGIVFFQLYNNWTRVYITENELSSARYYFVSGIRFE